MPQLKNLKIYKMKDYLTQIHTHIPNKEKN